MTRPHVVVLATLAQRTTRVKLVSHVACMLFRHPAMHARLFAQLDDSRRARLRCQGDQVQDE